LAQPLATTAAHACSPVLGYRVPTNLELTELADVILVGVAEKHTPSTEEHDLGEIVIRSVDVLKGGLPSGEVRIRGMLTEEPRFVIASNPKELYEPNPGTLIGGCTRYAFKRGMLLVLFLKRGTDGKLHLASYPFARSAEDVPSPDAPWVKAVRLYAEIAALPRDQRKAALKARRDALLVQADDPDAALLAKDISRQLSRKRIPPFD
jgi:hypothetical protein